MSRERADFMIDVERVRFRYRSMKGWALNDVSFQAKRGVVLGIVGPNGSGKTTLYRLILGLMPPSSGRISVGGKAPAAYRASRGIGYLAEQVRLPGNVRTGEFAELMGRLAGLGKKDREYAIERLMAFLGIGDRANSRIGTLSHGYRQRVGLLAALLGGPELLLFDEPANGLDPESVGILRSLLRSLKRKGRTVIVSSHNLVELERICDEILILRQGQLLGRCSRRDLLARTDIWVVQLGDEVVFEDQAMALGFAAHARAVGQTVEAIERRPFDLEYLFHSLVQESETKGG
jgi:ABC-2 type transport system ATP-binding protein